MWWRKESSSTPSERSVPSEEAWTVRLPRFDAECTLDVKSQITRGNCVRTHVAAIGCGAFLRPWTVRVGAGIRLSGMNTA